MSKMQKFITAICLFAMLTAGAVASDITSLSNFVGSEIPFTPVLSLDDVFDDTLSYYSEGTNEVYPSTAQNFHVGVRYTPAVEFIVQGFRIKVSGDATVGDVVARIYSNNNGQPGTVLDTLWNAPATAIEGDWLKVELEEFDYYTATGGEDFWFVLGPIDGVRTPPPATPFAWSPLIDADGAAAGERNKLNFSATGSPTNLNSLSPGDFMIDMLGEYSGGFYDYQALSLFNDIQLWHFEANTTVQLAANITNAGFLVDAPIGTVTFSIVDDSDNEVFTHTNNIISPVAPSEVLSVTCGETWLPTEVGRYVATVTIVGDDNESVIDNNVYHLIQEVVVQGDWMKYDDDSFETSFTMTGGGGWGTVFYPLSYPAQVDSMSWFFADSGSANLKIGVINPANPDVDQAIIWESTETVISGWNTFEIGSSATAIDGYVIVGIYEYTGTLSMMADTDNIVSNTNPDMWYASMSWTGEAIGHSDGGNYGIRAKLVEGAAPALVFPAGPMIQLGDYTGNGPHTLTIPITNTGNMDGEISAVELLAIDPGTEGTVTVVNTLPAVVPAEGALDIQLEWTPVQDGTSQGAIRFSHNDPVVASPTSPLGISMSVTGTSTDVDEDNLIPNIYYLEQNHPNPFNPTTNIQFGLKDAGHVRLTVYNIMGQEIASLVDAPTVAGRHSIVLDGHNLASGIYFYNIEVNGFTSMKKMSLMK
jgi:Secretion system C-terminal sorting domain